MFQRKNDTRGGVKPDPQDFFKNQILRPDINLMVDWALETSYRHMFIRFKTNKGWRLIIAFYTTAS